MTARLLLLALVITTPSFAQPALDARLPDAVAARRAFILTQAGMSVRGLSDASLLYRRTMQNWVQDAWQDSSRTTYTYVDGLTEMFVEEHWDGASWSPLTRTSFGYSGRALTAVTSDSLVGGAWVSQTRTLFTHQDGKVVSNLSKRFEGGTWVDASRTTITAPSADRSVSVTENWTGSAWQNETRTTDEQVGADVIRDWQQWDGVGWVNTSRSIYPGTTLSALEFDFQRVLLEFDLTLMLGLLVAFPDAVQQEWDGSQWVNLSRQRSERDAQGRAELILLEDWTGSEWETSSRLTLRYDSAGRLDRIALQIIILGWMDSLVESYVYRDDNLEEIVLQLSLAGFGMQNMGRALLEWTTSTGTASEPEELPDQSSITALYPNPFSSTTTLRYEINEPAHVRIAVYDLLGRAVAMLVDQVCGAGTHEAIFDAGGQANGTYVISLETRATRQSRIVTLLR